MNKSNKIVYVQLKEILTRGNGRKPRTLQSIFFNDILIRCQKKTESSVKQSQLLILWLKKKQ